MVNPDLGCLTTSSFDQIAKMPGVSGEELEQTEDAVSELAEGIQALGRGIEQAAPNFHQLGRQ